MQRNLNLNPTFTKTKSMHTREILEFLTWPLLILVSYWLAAAAIRKYEKKHDETSEK